MMSRRFAASGGGIASCLLLALLLLPALGLAQSNPLEMATPAKSEKARDKTPPSFSTPDAMGKPLAASAIVTLAVNGASISGNIENADAEDWFTFTVSTSGIHTVQTYPGTLTDTMIYLAADLNNDGIINANDILDYNDDISGANYMSRISRQLAPGRYYVIVISYGTLYGTYRIRVGNGPVITALSINYGAASTPSRSVKLDNICIASPTHYMASQSSSFAGATWQPYSTAPTFTLSAGNGIKRVYFKVRDASMRVSDVESASISLDEVNTVTVNSPSPTNGAITPAGEYDWYRFTVTTYGLYTMEARMTTLPNGYLRIYGPNSQTRLIGYRMNPTPSQPTKIEVVLDPGTYYIKFHALTGTATGGYTIRVSSGSASGLPRVNSFSINNGANLTFSRTVTLNNACSGSPTHYMASENSLFSGATWQPYSTAPQFTLSPDNLTKTVFFKVRNVSSKASSIKLYLIDLAEVIPIMISGAAVQGRIVSPVEVDWYKFTVATPGTYTISTSAGTLMDTVIGLTNSLSTFHWIGVNDDIAGNNYMSTIRMPLATGTYFICAMGYGVSTGTYSIRVASGSGAQQGVITPLTINGSTVSGGVAFATDADWYRFTVTQSGLYTIETFAGTLKDSIMYLMTSPFGETIDKNDDIDLNTNRMSRIKRNLTPGAYYVRVRGYDGSTLGAYTIRLTGNVGSGPIVQNMAINNGNGETNSRTVTLNNTCSGGPAYYMASESAAFTGAAWKTYATAPSFTLSAGNGVKTIYFKVRNAAGQASAVASDTIRLNESSSTTSNFRLVTVNGAAVQGNITASSNNRNTFVFEALGNGSYTIKATPGTLRSMTMTLYDVTNPKNAIATSANGTIVRTLNAGGYVLLVSSSPGSLGNFSVKVTGPNMGNGNENFHILTVNGSAIQGNITSGEDRDMFVFEATTTAVYTIQITPGSLRTAAIALMDISNPKEPIEVNDGSSGPARISRQLPPGGYMVVVNAPPAQSGAYSIRVTR